MKFLTYVSFSSFYFFHFDFALFFIKLFHAAMIKDCGLVLGLGPIGVCVWGEVTCCVISFGLVDFGTC